jgi:hypothetical protein
VRALIEVCSACLRYARELAYPGMLSLVTTIDQMEFKPNPSYNVLGNKTAPEDEANCFFVFFPHAVKITDPLRAGTTKRTQEALDMLNLYPKMLLIALLINDKGDGVPCTLFEAQRFLETLTIQRRLEDKQHNNDVYMYLSQLIDYGFVIKSVYNRGNIRVFNCLFIFNIFYYLLFFVSSINIAFNFYSIKFVAKILIMTIIILIIIILIIIIIINNIGNL